MLDKEIIQKTIDDNMCRNAELLALLRKKEVALEAIRKIEFHYWATDETEAIRLESALIRNGTTVKDIVQLKENDENIWSVTAEAELSPSSAASLEQTRGNALLAAEFNCVYDGWGTCI